MIVRREKEGGYSLCLGDILIKISMAVKGVCLGEMT